MNVEDNILRDATEAFSIGEIEENNLNYGAALRSFERGLQSILDLSRQSTNSIILNMCVTLATKYVPKTEIVKYNWQQENSNYPLPQHIHIPHKGCGFSYAMIFNRCLNEEVHSIKIYEPYLRSMKQIVYLQEFVRVIIDSCVNLKTVSLETSKSTGRDKDLSPEIQREALQNVGDLLNANNVSFKFLFSKTLHDTEIVFNNGFSVKIGRGLDFFSSDSPFEYQHLRKCKETVVDIYKSY